MRLGGRLAAAIEVLEDIERRHRPAADALKDWGLSHRFAGAGDRAATGNIVYDGLRRRRSAGWLVGADTPRAVAIGALLIEARMTPDTLNAALDGDKFAPEPLSADEIAGIKSRESAMAPDEIRADSPDWCVPLIKSALGANWADEAAALAARPPLDLRVNTLKSDRDKVLRELAPTGAAPAALAADGIRIPPIAGAGRHPNVQAEGAFQKGWFEVQDEGSQLVATLAAGGVGDHVLDYCAGAGGKTLALSALSGNHGQIFAFDAEKVRLAPIYDRLKRAGSHNVQVISHAGGLEQLKGKMDLVLVDAPCTGSGTWRRRPDAKWRLTARQLDVRKGEQAAILDAASAYVRPGGRLAYITCSIFEDENRLQTEAFVDRKPAFRPENHAELWAKAIAADPARARVDTKAGISLTPALTGTDGFYFCALRNAG